jgi:hypothetical protein
VNAVTIILFTGLGAGAGAVHFLAIGRDADLLVQGGRAWAAAGLRAGRMLLTIGLLVVAGRQGWPMLLGALLGFMAARQIVMRKWRGAA